MPLVQVVGGLTREDRTQRYKLDDAPDGRHRYVERDGPPVQVSGHELRKLAGVCEVRVLQEDPLPTSAYVGLSPSWAPQPVTSTVTQSVATEPDDTEASGEADASEVAT
jgi:hypothetical protein